MSPIPLSDRKQNAAGLLVREILSLWANLEHLSQRKHAAVLAVPSLVASCRSRRSTGKLIKGQSQMIQ